MKIQSTILLTLLSLFFAEGELQAQSKSKTPIYRDVKVAVLGDSVEVSFNHFVSKRALKRDYIMTVEPQFSDDTQKLSLPVIEVYSSYSSLLERKRYFYDKLIKPNIAEYKLERGNSLLYKCKFGYESWMANASLQYVSTVKGCCETVEEPAVALNSNAEPKLAVLPVEPKSTITSSNIPVVNVVPVVAPPVLAVATTPLSIQQLKAKYSAVSDISDYKYGELKREGSITIYFEKGSSKIDVMHRDNIESLKLLGEIASLSNSDSTFILGKVVIAGFASVEGSYTYNLKLSERRSEALRKYVSHFTTLDSDVLDISYKGEDWHGLYDMVKNSRMKYKQEVMDIIDNVSLFEGREKRLMDLKGGAPYKYMKNNFFPEFRKAGYVHFYYKAN